MTAKEIMKEYKMFVIIIIIIIRRGRQCKAEGVIYTLSVRRPQQHNTNQGKIEEDNSKDRAPYANKKALALLLKPVSPTPANRVSNTVPEGPPEENKSHAVLRGSAARRRI